MDTRRALLALPELAMETSRDSPCLSEAECHGGADMGSGDTGVLEYKPVVQLDNVRKEMKNLFQLLKSSWSMHHMTPRSLCSPALKRNVLEHHGPEKRKREETLYNSAPDWLGRSQSVRANSTLKCPLLGCVPSQCLISSLTYQGHMRVLRGRKA